MTEWVDASRRTSVTVAVISVLWMGGVVTGLISQHVNDVADLICDLMLFAMFAVSIGSVVFGATRYPMASRMRWGWLIAAIGLVIAFAASLRMVLAAAASPAEQFSGQSLGMTMGFLVGGTGIAIAASSIGEPGLRLRPFLQALTLSGAVFVMMLGALLAPGPAMPFSVGPRDVMAAWRLLIDCGALLLPAIYATLAQLRTAEAHRARAWMWAAAGALVLCMGDVGAPLVDLGHGQIYPTLLWALGIILLAGAMSLFADFEVASRSVEQPPAVPVADPARS